MDVLDESLLQFWRLVHQHAVSYIMVGGLAVNRPKDQIDVAALEKIKELLREQQRPPQS
jgi:predicted histidine transporter YuiF (NhaC family)